MADCDQRGWTDDEQEFDKPCVCYLAAGHEGLHQCGEGCGSEWAGGMAPGDSGSGVES